MNTIKEVAERAGVSISTVSRVLNNTGYVKERTRQAILLAMAELNFQPNAVARSLVRRQTGLIGLLIPYIDSAFFVGLARGVESAAKDLGYSTLLCHTQGDPFQEQSYLKTLMERRVDGIILTPVCQQEEYVRSLIESGFPVVLVSRKLNTVAANAVLPDNTFGARTVIEHLIKLGHTRIGIINGPHFLSNARERWEGVRMALAEAGLEPQPELIREGNFLFDDGYWLSKELLAAAEPPSAIFCANHIMAGGAMMAIRDQGLRIPEDISLAAFEGFDDSILGRLIQPSLTANIFPTREMSLKALSMLDRLIKEGRDRKASTVYEEVRMVMTFKPGTSTGPPA
jgi:LacI family transcriptional regulator